MFQRYNFKTMCSSLYLLFFQRRQSTETAIMLKHVVLDTTGKFRCEISGEAPLFQTAFREAILAVVGKFND